MIAFLVIVAVMLAVLVVGCALEKSREFDQACDWLLPDHPRDGEILDEAEPSTCGVQSPVLTNFECANPPHADEHHYFRSRYWLTDQGWAAVRDLEKGGQAMTGPGEVLGDGVWCAECEFFEPGDFNGSRCMSCGCSTDVHRDVQVVAT